MSLDTYLCAAGAINASVGALAVVLHHIRTIERDRQDHDLAMRAIKKCDAGTDAAELMTAYAGVASARAQNQNLSTAAIQRARSPSAEPPG